MQDAKTTGTKQATAGEVEINLLRVVQLVDRGSRRILWCTVAGLILGVALALYLSPVYTAEAVFLPPISQDSSQGANFLFKQSSSDLYLGMVGSRAVADSVIDQLNLMKVYKAGTRTAAQTELKQQSTFGVDKNELISVRVTTKDPKLSADIGNAYLDALYRLNGSMASSAALHRQQFIEAQLNAEKEQLTQAEAAVRQTQESTGTVLPEGEAQAGLSATARLQAAIQEQEVALSTLLTSETARNPQVVELQARIGMLREQLRQQQTATSASASGLASTAKLPGLLMQSLRAGRDLKDREALYESLRQQYEKARIATSDPGPQLQVVDRAVPPEMKSGPPRKGIVLGFILVGAIFGVASILLPVAMRKLSARYREFKQSEDAALA